MYQLKRLILLFAIITCFLIQAQGADKYTDEKRPYEFGFSIDGEQHRHEKKDKNGIIMGEFGFITADGVYHVTVYATDEQGRFKILSMKNIRVKPYPTWHPKDSARQGHSLSLPPSQDAPIPSTLSTTQRPPEKQIKQVSIEPPANSCSHCSLPTTTTPAPKLAKPSNNQQNNNSPSQSGAPGSSNSQYPQGAQSPSSFPSQLNNNKPHYPQPISGLPRSYPAGQLADVNNLPISTQQGPSIPQKGFKEDQTYTQKGSETAQNYPSGQQNSLSHPQLFSHQASGTPQQGGNNAQTYTQQNFEPVQNYPTGQQNSLKNPKITSQQEPVSQNYPQQGFQDNNGQKLISPQQGSKVQDEVASQYPGQEQSSLPEHGTPIGERTSKQLNDFLQQPFGSQNEFSQGGQSVSKKPTLIAAQIQIVDKNTDIYHKGPGENEGLPEGLNKNDISHLLYTFNYTLGFQGHFEEGYTNGVKQGYYFVTGRNGVRTRVDYVADAKGFHPKITQEVLDLLSNDVPKPETEKDEQYGLKGYEFKWLYYPVETKKQ